jgi:hypothetical protein
MGTILRVLGRFWPEGKIRQLTVDIHLAAPYDGAMNITSKPRATKKPTTLSDQLRQAMADHSAYRLSKDSGVNVAAILRFKSGERGLTLESADRLAAVLGLELRAKK